MLEDSYHSVFSFLGASLEQMLSKYFSWISFRTSSNELCTKQSSNTKRYTKMKYLQRELTWSFTDTNNLQCSQSSWNMNSSNKIKYYKILKREQKPATLILHNENERHNPRPLRLNKAQNSTGSNKGSLCSFMLRRVDARYSHAPGNQCYQQSDENNSS